MFKNSFKTKIIVPIVIVIIAAIVLLNIFLSVRFSAISSSLVSEKLYANINSLKQYLSDNRDNTRMAAVSMTNHPDVRKAIREQDAETLIRILTPMTSLYQISSFTVCDRDGRVIARTHEPENAGDLILDQQNIADALDGRIASYFETSPSVRVSIHTGAPAYDTDGSLIGVVSAGVRFDLTSEVEELKRLFHAEFTIFLGDTRIATTITREGESIVGTTMDPRIVETVLVNKQEYTGDLEIMGERYKTFYMPLLNAQGNAFASFFLGIPETEISRSIQNTMRDGIAFGLISLIVSILLLYFIISSITKPITKLCNDMNQIANGNLGVDILVRSKDEVGQLGMSLKKIANILQKLIRDINQMIAEHDKGNTDYYIDPEAFHGDYKVLAGNILELTNVGSVDQLTGIPNRRSFDNRMDLEWNRAIRDQQPLSILMLDVDKFKNYNDAFGHQQGDAALQAVARIITLSVKRSVDLAARWGGEEFIVLLPSTDAAGAISVAEKIRLEIQNANIPCADDKAKKITVSVGISTEKPTHDSMSYNFISAADNALYKAKESGRNMVCLYEKENPSNLEG